jgi:hypothetical protein
VPYLVDTETAPQVALVDTVATMEVAELAEITAFFPPIITFLAAARPEPEMVTTTALPAAPDVGLKEAIAGDTWNAVGLVAVPNVVTTVTTPSIAPVGTVATTAEFVAETIVPGTPPKRTWMAELRLVPEMVMSEPAVVAVGVTEVMVGEYTNGASPSTQPPLPLFARFDHMPWTATVPVASDKLNA